jgi:hypothetical protein
LHNNVVQDLLALTRGTLLRTYKGLAGRGVDGVGFGTHKFCLEKAKGRYIAET